MPGVLFPSDVPRPTSSQAEKTVYEVLKRQLPEGWWAWHSLRLVVHRGVYEGEGDFVLAIPERGILVLEVKGGHIELRDGHWFQDSHPMKRPPRDQATDLAHRLWIELRNRKLEVPYGSGCVFPDTEFSVGPGNGDLRDAVIGTLQLNYFRESIESVVKAVVPPRPVPPFDRWRSVLHRLWGETWVPHVKLRDRVDAAGQRMLALDAEQLEILDVAAENPRALVEGGAGTGKTVVARELCRRRALEGKRVLYLCYTEALAHAIEQQFRDMDLPPGQLRAAPVRQFARELLGEDGPPPSADSLEFWEQVSLRAVDRVPALAQRPDCIVVDEGQDLAVNDWRFVEALAEGRGLWLFHDPRQAFWSQRGVPRSLEGSLMRLRLKKQQRCPEVIARFADCFVDPEAPVPPADESGALRLIQGEDADLIARLTATLDQLLNQGAKPEEIAVLSLGGQKRSVLQHLDQVGSHRLVRCDSPEAGGAVVADTFLRFKGLERPFVVVAELEGGLDHKFGTRMHIALTRATVAVRILCTAAERDRDPRLQRLAVPG